MSRGGKVCFVGNLPNDVRERELRDLFSKYGDIRHVDLKIPPRPPAFAFVEFEDPRDAEDAVRGRDGYDFYGNRLRVELAHGARGPPPPPPGGFRGRGTGFRAVVKGLPLSASWQDLKDHFRKIIKPAYTNVYRDRNQGVIGVVEFETREDLRKAIKKLDDTEFRNPFDRGYIRVQEDNKGGRSRSRSFSRSRSRSPIRSRSRSRGRSVSRSPSRSKSRSVTPSRSRSRSKSPAYSKRSRSKSPRAANGKGRSPSRSVSRSRSRSRS